jgi:putative membrane protein
LFAGTAPAQLAAIIPIACLYLAVYAALVRRARDRPGGRRVGAGHVLPFAAGVVVLVAVGLPPVSTGADELLSIHMLQHVALADIAPALLVLGLRAPLLTLALPKQALRLLAPGGRFGRVAAIATNPLVVLPAWIGFQIGWSLPAAMQATQTSSALHLLQHATLFYSGILLWWIVVDPLGARSRQPRFSRLAVLGVSRAATAAVCLPLTFLPAQLFPAFAETTAARGLDPLVDQRLAGAAMCFLELLVFGLAFLVVFVNALSREEREEHRRARAVGTA